MTRKVILFIIHKLAVRIAKATIDPDLKKVLPNIYGDLDKEMPTMLRHGTGRTIETSIIDAITKYIPNLGPIKAVDLANQVRALYDPVKGVLR